ncbi:DUF456 domain-containing protein [Haloprofundus salilacus]|uniref:DUF456 domain-containing protein n=1 Tax=Haloprofundus salilacus TaxID=2876190 RepID=UPI001CCF2B07|nr:DUF456 domain-containing protein [Haloprofundus salilacus]
MVEPLGWIALALLVVGVVGSVAPLVPGALASLAGVYLYWWSTEFGEPGLLAVVGLTFVGLTAVVFDYFAGPIAARYGGASNGTTVVAAVVGFLAFFVAGPPGILLGVAGTVFALEFYRNRDANASFKSALLATVGVLASTAVQVVLTLLMLVAFVLLVFV